MKKAISLEELVKKYLSEGKTLGVPDSYDLYKHKNNLQKAKSYSDAVGSLYASSKRSLSTFGENSRKINNKGLQNSGYAAYIDADYVEMFEDVSFVGEYGSGLHKYREY